MFAWGQRAKVPREVRVSGEWGYWTAERWGRVLALVLLLGGVQVCLEHHS